jgi:hypothetical protein
MVQVTPDLHSVLNILMKTKKNEVICLKTIGYVKGKINYILLKKSVKGKRLFCFPQSSDRFLEPLMYWMCTDGTFPADKVPGA